jgi:membrane-bound lytic murein transglycosylase B
MERVLKISGSNCFKREDMRRNFFVALFMVAALLFFGNGNCTDSPSSQVGSYESSSIDLESRYPDRYQLLYAQVKDIISKQEFDTVMSKKEGIELDERHKNKLIFIVSPRSIEMQKQQHVAVIPLKVNAQTLKDGEAFFHEYETVFKSAYEKTGVSPADIVAILNWESGLGKRKGTYSVFKIFVAQYFYLEEIEKELFDKGAYEETGAMTRQEAMKRMVKLRERSLSNLSQLLIQAKNMNFDPLMVRGSWAGAIGIPQFMPASMRFARDGDNDGIIDLNTIPDAIVSVASFLKSHGYHEKGNTYAFRRYNPEAIYVQGVGFYGSEIENMGVKPKSGWSYFPR